MKISFEKGKEYVVDGDIVIYKEQDAEGYWVFKYKKHETLDEYATKDGTEVKEK